MSRLLCLAALLLAVAAAPAAAQQCVQYGGYPFVQGGCVNARDLNRAIDLTFGPAPPSNQVGNGAGFGHLWGDTSTSPATLRLCLTSPSCSVTYNASEWAVLGTADQNTKQVSLAGANLATVTLSALPTGSVGLGQRLYITNAALLPKTVTAPACSAANDGKLFAVVDQVGNAGTYNVTILPPGGTTIDGSNTAVFQSNRQSATWVCYGAAANWTNTNGRGSTATISEPVPGISGSLTAHGALVSTCITSQQFPAIDVYAETAAASSLQVQRYSDPACAFPAGTALPSVGLALTMGGCSTGSAYCGDVGANDGLPFAALKVTLTDTSGAPNAIAAAQLSLGPE